MPQGKKRQKTPAEEHTFLAIRVERYEASVDAGINHNVYAPEHAWNLDDGQPLYRFTTRLTMVGVATYPPPRGGDTYEFTIYGDDLGPRNLRATLKDAQARDEHGSPKYRSYRSRQVPIYTPPKGIGLDCGSTPPHVRAPPAVESWSAIFVLLAPLSWRSTEILCKTLENDWGR